MQEIDHESQDYYILATSSRADERTRVIKHGETFAVFDTLGTIRREGFGELGVYHDGTRFVSQFEIALARRRPMLLGSTARHDGVLVLDLANPDLPEFPGGMLDRDSIHIGATFVLWGGAWYARFLVHNYARRRIELDLAFMFGADFADVFEVRGMKRDRRGTCREPIVERDAVTLVYDGLDHQTRTTRFEIAPVPRRLSHRRAELRLELDPAQSIAVDLRAGFGIDRPPQLGTFEAAFEALTTEHAAGGARIATNNERFDAWLERSSSDLAMMTTSTEHGPYPYAGVPWFSTPFGRDGIITAFERLWLDPELARGVLHFLAATQATESEPDRDADPGKIIHELRLGEMAALHEIPFDRYYGSVDATPMFVMLAAAYYQRTGDRATIEELWPNLRAALAWLDTYGDIDGDGFIEYARRSHRGLVVQGWKDSHDSVSHADGMVAEAPIALCEVQGYAYAARRGGAKLARVLGLVAEGNVLDTAAEALRAAFEHAFWSEQLGSYVLALDANKRPCEVRASNAGHLLWTGIAAPERARRVADALFAPSTFSGWGLRTLDANAARFNPISYHNGSVWPHDNALCALGLARYGFKTECARLLSALFDASHTFDLGRTPELFCGFTRRASQGPTSYPVACAPQSWSAGAVFMLLQACLGVMIDAPHHRIVFDRPMLPPWLTAVTLGDLCVDGARVDISLRGVGDDLSLHVEQREGAIEIAAIKC